MNQPSRTETLRRRGIRLTGFDYTHNSGYFITVGAANRTPLFGRIVNSAVRLSPLGRIVEEEWRKTGDRRPYLAFDIHTVMPNHFHALFEILRDSGFCLDIVPGAVRPHHLKGPAAYSVGAIVRAFKSAVGRRARLELSLPGTVWQRNYFEHIVRTPDEFGNAHHYILRNAENWEIDHDRHSQLPWPEVRFPESRR